MKALILYDSEFGNTEKVALAIHAALGALEGVSVHAVRAGDARPDQFEGLNLLIAGAPTQRFRTTPAMDSLLKSLPAGSLKGVRVAAFDTRLTMEEINQTPVLAFFVKLFGPNAYAARFIANQLKKKGGQWTGSQEGFYVEGMKGPLVSGELERAVGWGKQIVTGPQ